MITDRMKTVLSTACIHTSNFISTTSHIRNVSPCISHMVLVYNYWRPQQGVEVQLPRPRTPTSNRAEVHEDRVVEGLQIAVKRS